MFSYQNVPEMIRLSSMATWLPFVAAVAIAVTAAGCDSTTAKPDKISANISGYNHTPGYIHEFYVNDSWGGNVFAYSGGGKFVCCIVYPAQWRPELQATVKWTTSSSDPNATGDDAVGHWHEVTVPIERYAQPGTRLNVHFLPEGRVRLIIASSSDWAPGYLGPRLEPKPKDFKW